MQVNEFDVVHTKVKPKTLNPVWANEVHVIVIQDKSTWQLWLLDKTRF